MPNENFTKMSDKEIWEDLYNTEMKVELFNSSPLIAALRSHASDKWCCDLWKKGNIIKFKDGTRMRVHFCPRCGRYLGA